MSFTSFLNEYFTPDEGREWAYRSEKPHPFVDIPNLTQPEYYIRDIPVEEAIVTPPPVVTPVPSPAVDPNTGLPALAVAVPAVTAAGLFGKHMIDMASAKDPIVRQRGFTLQGGPTVTSPSRPAPTPKVPVAAATPRLPAPVVPRLPAPVVPRLPAPVSPLVGEVMPRGTGMMARGTPLGPNRVVEGQATRVRPQALRAPMVPVETPPTPRLIQLPEPTPAGKPKVVGGGKTGTHFKNVQPFTTKKLENLTTGQLGEFSKSVQEMSRMYEQGEITKKTFSRFVERLNKVAKNIPKLKGVVIGAGALLSGEASADTFTEGVLEFFDPVGAMTKVGQGSTLSEQETGTYTPTGKEWWMQ